VINDTDPATRSPICGELCTLFVPKSVFSEFDAAGASQENSGFLGLGAFVPHFRTESKDAFLWMKFGGRTAHKGCAGQLASKGA
jgi:hypothetical protein